MRCMRRFWALILAAVLTLSLAAPALAANKRYRAIVTVEEAAGDTVAALLEEMEDVELLYRYDLLFSGAAVEATDAALAKIAALPGVECVGKAADHQLPASAEDPLLDSNSLPLMNGGSLPYSGDGMVIAVIDAGLRWSHEAFQDYGLAKSPAISREDVNAFVEKGGTPGKYLSARIPFAYDYSGRDREVFSLDSHGTHVSALALGYARDEDGGVKFRGVAPAAQLLSMKVFPDNATRGANDADVLKALEDAYALGADVINLSLGVDNGFATTDGLGGAYRKAIATLEAAGVVICCAAGNGGSATSQLESVPTADFTDYGTMAAPAVYGGATPIAAANAQVYESSGGLLVGSKRISYNIAVSENDLKLPGLEVLADRDLEYVLVPGLGTPEDFASVDVRGKVAVVMRGTITFTEKTLNAAAAGAVALLVTNNVAEPVNPIVEVDTIPCAIIAMDAGEYLAQQAVENKQGKLLFKKDSYLVDDGDAVTMLPASAWGAVSDLRFAPALTAPGGIILSAAGEGDSLYEQFSGTSMASPNAAGAFALALERAYKLGVEGRESASVAAAALLESTAALAATDTGVPLSPRRQGAGLIDLTAALESGAMVTRPLLELGEYTSDSFRLSFLVENFSDVERTWQLDTRVLTDDYENRNGAWYSLLSPRDITAGCTVEAPETITVPGGSSLQVLLTVTLSPELLRELEEVFPNGFFTEGYVMLTEGDGSSLHASFMGYRGDWEKAPVIEPVDFLDVLDAERATGKALAELGVDYEELLDANLGINLVWHSGYDYNPGNILGDNPLLTEEYLADRAAISTPETDAMYSDGALFYVDLYTLRNAAHVIMVVSNRSTGQIYHVQDYAWLTRSGLDSLLMSVEGAARFMWNGSTGQNTYLPDGTRLLVEFYAWTESDTAAQTAYDSSGATPARPASYAWLTTGSYDRCLEWSFPVTVDRKAPTVTARGGETPGTVVFTVRDNQYLAHAVVKAGDGSILAEESFADAAPGQEHTLQVSLAGMKQLPEQLYVTARDYAGNLTGCAVDAANLSPDSTARISPCGAAVLTDVLPDAWYHDAVDRVWMSGMIETREELTFAPGDDATRAVVVSALYELAGRPNPASWHMPYTDVNAGATYRDALLWAHQRGITTGYSGTLFAGHASLPRQQLVTMLYRYACITQRFDIDDSVLDSYADAQSIPYWAEDAMAWAIEAGYITGYEDGLLRPEKMLTRAELSQILVRFMDDQP